MAHRNFKDLLGRLIKNGASVLYIWSKYESTRKGHGGNSVKYIIGKVVGFNASSIRLEYIEHKSTVPISKIIPVFKTENKIIVMKGLDILDQNTYANLLENRNDLLRKFTKDLIESNQALNRANSKIDRMGQKIDKFKDIIDEYEKNWERFRILDL